VKFQRLLLRYLPVFLVSYLDNYQFTIHPCSVLYYAWILVQGFVSLADVSSPPVYSRHLILPVSQGKVSNRQCCGSGAATNLVGWIRIRIQEGHNNPQKQSFEVLDVLC
jgi:hypothetical protein